MGERRGYAIGPTLAPGEQPWPTRWEDDPAVAECPHDWECVLLAPDNEGAFRLEEVVRCVHCHAPRCGHSTDDDPCDLVRHHRGEHLPHSVASKVPHIEEDPIAIRHGWTRWQKNQSARRPSVEKEREE